MIIVPSQVMAVYVRFLDLIYGVLTSPVQAFSQISATRPWTLALTALIFPSIVAAFILVPNMPQLAEVIMSLEKNSLHDRWYLWTVWVLFLPLVLLLQAVFFHVSASLFGGRGSCLGMFYGLSFAYLPWIFFAPLGLLRAVMESASGQAIYYAVTMVIFSWVFSLQIISLRQNYLVSWRRAVLATSTALMLMFGIPVFILIGLTATQSP